MACAISIIIPIYNVEKYIFRCLNSVATQTFKDIEIIVVNDLTPDNSMEIVERISEKDERIKIINNVTNIGSGESRNQGLLIAEGKYVFFVDSDDWLEKYTLEILYNIAERENVDIVECGSNLVYEDGTKSKFLSSNFYTLNNIEATMAMSEYKMGYMPWGKLYKLDLFRCNEIKFPKYKPHDDIVLALKCVYFAKGVISVPFCCYNYFQSEGSAIRKPITFTNMDCYFEVLDDVNQFISKHLIFESNPKCVHKILEGIMLWLIQNLNNFWNDCGDSEDKIEMFYQALKKHYSYNSYSMAFLILEMSQNNNIKNLLGQENLYADLNVYIPRNLQQASEELLLNQFNTWILNNKNKNQFQATEKSLGSVCGTINFLHEAILDGGLRTKGLVKKSLPRRPLVTIVTVVYNCETKIERAMKSVLNQTYPNIEYIVIDGGSTDGTLNKIQSFSEEIDYFASNKDKGIYDAMNKAISLAKGDFIGIVNADDYFFEDAIETSIEKIMAQNADYSIAEDYCVDENGNYVGTFQIYPPDEIAFIGRLLCNHGTMIISKQIYDKVGVYDITHPFAADYKLQLEIIRHNCFKCVEIYRTIHCFEMAGVSVTKRKDSLEDVRSIICEYSPQITIKEAEALVYFLHENKWDDDIIMHLENILVSEILSFKQKQFILSKMQSFGYVCRTIKKDEFPEASMHDMNKKRKIKKIIKSLLPYGVIKLYAKYKYKIPFNEE